MENDFSYVSPFNYQNDCNQPFISSDEFIEAYLNEDTTPNSKIVDKIQILHEIMESSLYYKVIKSLFSQIKPRCVIVSCLQDEIFLKVLKQLANNDKVNLYARVIDNNENTTINNIVHILPNKYFSYNYSKQLIMNMPLKSMPISLESKKRYISSIVDLSNELTVSALGALLYYIEIPHVKVELQIIDNVISSLKPLKLEGHVWLSAGTYESLQIFTATEKPSTSMGTSAMILSLKEERSVLSVLNRCCNQALSYKYLKMILAHPTNSIDVLIERHEVIAFFLMPQNEAIVLSIINCIKRCYSIAKIIKKISGCNDSVKEWQKLSQTVVNAIKIGEICGKYSLSTKMFRKIKEALTTNLYDMSNTMTNLIDFESSKKFGRIVINSGWIPSLDEKKLKMRNVSTTFEEICIEELQNLPVYIQSCFITKNPNFGFLLAIPLWKTIEKKLNGQYENSCFDIPGLNFKYIDENNIVFYKTTRCTNLDEFVEKMELSILYDEVNVMIKLIDIILQTWISDLHDMLALISELDCLLGFASAARELKLTKPIILPKDECFINIIKGRHFLQEIYVNEIIPNSYFSSQSSAPIKILNGFNASGKSVYLKQVALIAYLSHIGSYVSAEMVTISVLDHIFTRIQSNESISTLMSAFMIDLKQMSVALNESTCKSLVVLDEFGKGTSDTNGLSILLACVVYFVKKPLCLLPHIIISTHFYMLPIMLPQLIQEAEILNKIKYFTMNSTIVNDKIEYSYKIEENLVNEYHTTSMAHKVAVFNGLPNGIINRASRILQNNGSNNIIPPMSENSRYQLILKRKKFIQDLLTTNESIPDIFNSILDSLEDIRYP
ncbi:mutS protein homolog 5-like isoform X2 [Daktulosphaira vitifoliae]|uniref:mutS protein homolog 5-like isoform X2 n=1 Tax=Daktulosphaira vitifoliae TaxID=58002 RepID=UPI0021A9A438|nr:mutS protein homolog 5-like isoform X2 [Daktulosphaira vitifoliae]